MGNVTAKTSGDIASFMTPAETNIKSLKVHFSPKQLGEGDPSPENVREIVGWDGVEVNGAGRNLLQNANGSLSYLHLKKGTTITISQSMDSNVGYFRGYDINKTINTPLVWINQKNNGKRRWSEYTLEDDIYYAVCYTGTGMKEAQITLDGSVDFEPYQGNNISYQWKLPDEYQEVEYIESNGNQFIQLPFGFDDTDEIETVFSINQNSVDKYIISPSVWNNNGNRFGMGRHTGQGGLGNTFTAAYGTRMTGYTYLEPPTAPDYDLHKWTYKNHVFAIPELEISRDVSEIGFGGTTANLKLFYGYNSNTYGKISYYKHIKSNASYYLIACYRKSDGEIGLYDIANSVFYTNQGTGTFLKGEDVDKTFYGGYIDLISGELVDEYSIFDLESTVKNIQNFSSFSMWYSDSLSSLGIDLTPSRNSAFKGYCNTYPIYPYNAKAQDTNYNVSVRSDGNRRAIYVRTNGTSDIKPSGNIILKLATPITHQLTPTQLSSFIGQNNFWSNADYVEIEYELKETEDIQKARKKIILNQPHIESVKDDLVNFTTNMKAPLKECKVYFEPVQEGEGDPSPENVRNITGWDGVNVYSSNEITLFNSFSATSGRTSGINNNKRVTTNSYGTTINRTDTDGIKTELIITQSIADSTKERFQNGYVSLFPNTDKLIIGNSYYFDADIEIISNPLDKLPEMMLTDDANNRWTITINDGKLHEAFTWKERPTVYQYPFIEFYCNGCSFKLKNMVIVPSREVKTINWTDQTGTVYGGYVDLISGELVSDMAMVEFDGSSDENWQVETLSSGLANYYMYSTSLIPKAKGNQRADGYICSNMCTPRGINDTYTSGMFYFSTSGALNVYLGGKSNTSTVAEFKSWLTEHKLQIAYWLAEPIHYQLTPQQLLTLKGTNNIWSNSNGQTEIKFWTH